MNQFIKAFALSSVIFISLNLLNPVVFFSDNSLINKPLENKAAIINLTNRNAPNQLFSINAATLTDDFEDGNLDGWGNIADWANSTETPITGNYSLKHNLPNTADAQSYIYHSISTLDLNTKTVIWRFNLKNGAWDPSSTSKFWFYLLANETNLNGATVDGYAVGVDLTGTSDLLTLWKVTDGAVAQTLITSSFNWNTSDLVGIEVHRSVSGEWSLYFQDGGNFDNMSYAGSATNTDYIFTDYCGLVFHIIASRAGQLWFDDLTIGQDEDPPTLQSITSTDVNKLRLKFSENLEQTTAETILNYSVDNSIGNPATAVLNGTDPSIVDLSFASSFITNQNYGLTITNVQDISGNPIIETTTNFTYVPFSVNDIFALNKNELIVEFSRNLDPVSASTLTNYTVDNSIGNPATAVLQTDNHQVKLSFAADFPVDVQLNLNITNLEDENNVVIDVTNKTFYWHNAAVYDLAINEIMADPNPVVGLPLYEYLEIYNKTAYPICLQDWRMVVGTTARNFPLQNIQAGEYLIVCSQAAQAELNVYGNTVGILGSSDLTNSGKELALKTVSLLTIDTLKYTDAWYQDIDKDNGGWSIERIDPENTCGQLSNWKAAVDISGGTPGAQNSVYQPNVDMTPPKLTDISVLSSSELKLTFNKELIPGTASEVLNFLLDNSINPINAFLTGTGQNSIQITFQNAVSDGEHSLRISNIEDLCGNSIGVFDTVFTYYPGSEFDILINELMLDISPEPNVLPAAKYIEIYNQTDLNIDLTGWALLIDDNIKYFSDIQIAAKSYLILCDDDDVDLFTNYGKVYGIFTSSNLGASQGQISIVNGNSLLIDYVNYSNDWYGDEEKNSGGWSLERIDYANYCGLSTNWSATTDYKGGTPGEINAIYTSNADTETFEIVNIEVLSSAKIAVQFSKNIKEEQALNTTNYTVDNGPGNPLFVSFSDTSRTTVILQFTTQFTDAFAHTLTVKNIIDYCDNQLVALQKQFTYYLISPKAAYAESENIVKIIFSEEVEIVTAQQTENYLIEPDLDEPFKAYKHNTNTNEVYLEFSLPFESGKEYTILIENVKDLNGNTMRAAELTFSYFEPEWNDIVLNEILFNPKTGGVDFVEIYNNSIYPVDIKHLRIAKRDDEQNLASIEAIHEENSMLLPGTYLAITSDTSLTKTDYPATSYEYFTQVKSMPSYADDEGTVVLLFQDTIIDEFSYSDNMHVALISDKNGVSLERLNPDAETADPQNWFSAAESVGFATPANKNSQFTQFSGEITNEILIEPEVFSPNNDGYDDRTFIRYKFAEPGYIANITIYNSHGQLVKRIANNELLAVEGSFSWDGLYEDNQRVTIGIYIIYFEVFNLQGNVKSYKKTCVVATKLN